MRADHMLQSTDVVCTSHHESQAKRAHHRRDSFISGAGVDGLNTPLSWNPSKSGRSVLVGGDGVDGLNASELQPELVDPSRVKGTSFPTVQDG